MNISLENLKNNQSFCSMAWNHMFFLTNNIVKPCCRFEYEKFDKNLNLNNHNISEIFYGEWYNDFRKKMINGEKIDGCKRCYEEENNGKKSLRQRYNDSYHIPIQDNLNIENPKIKWIELSISNKCNLICRMCDSRYSHLWYEEEKEFYGKTFSINKKSFIDLDKILEIIDENIIHIKFTGGEPFLIEEYDVIIDKLIQKADPSKIFLNYNTNCTILPKKEIIDKWKKFKFIEFAISFDGIGEIWEYIRYPSKWSKVEKNILFLYNLKNEMNSKYIFRSTISILNIMDIFNMIDWWRKNISNELNTENITFNPTHLSFPSFLSLHVLPEKTKEKIRNFLESKSIKEEEIVKKYINHYISYMYFRDKSEQLTKLKKYIQITDKNRNQNFYQIYKNFYENLFD